MRNEHASHCPSFESVIVSRGQILFAWPSCDDAFTCSRMLPMKRATVCPPAVPRASALLCPRLSLCPCARLLRYSIGLVRCAVQCGRQRPGHGAAAGDDRQHHPAALLHATGERGDCSLPHAEPT
eukprot:6180548-Pleurochrysis_carterae.AAC.1